MPQTCGKASGVPNSFLQFCGKASGTPDLFPQFCNKASGMPNVFPQFCDREKGLQNMNISNKMGNLFFTANIFSFSDAVMGQNTPDFQT